MATPAARAGPARPPEKGSFPLDHFGECQDIAQAYQSCLKKEKNVGFYCRELAKQYLKCRMDNNLMAHESWDKLGFHESDKDIKIKERKSYQTGRIAGIQRAKGKRSAESEAEDQRDG